MLGVEPISQPASWAMRRDGSTPQPDLLDDGHPTTDQIAELARFAPLQAGTTNQADCAVARLLGR